MLFIDSSRFSPVVNGKDVPHERDMYWSNPEEIPETKKQYEMFSRKFIIDRQWWQRQRSRCENGYVVPGAVVFEGGDTFADKINMDVLPDGSRYIRDLHYTVNPNGDIWIPGPMYMYLNFWKISIEDKAKGKKDYNHPWFTDLSWENWMKRQLHKKLYLDQLWAKCRQRGLSEEEAADSGWIMMFMENVQVGITSGEDKYNNNTFQMIKNGVKAMKNTQFYCEIERDNDKLFSTSHTGIEIHNRTAKNNAQVFSGLNKLYKAHLEEIGIMSRGLAPAICQYIRPSITTGGTRRTGYITMTGTSGVYEDGVADMEEMLYNPEKNKLLSIENTFDPDPDPENIRIACYIPAWKFRIMDDNGNSLKKESIEDVERCRKLEPEKSRPLLTALEPLLTKDMFGITPGGFFGDVISHHCSEARSAIITHKSLHKIERGKLHWKDPRKRWIGRPEWEITDEGNILIAEHPKTFFETINDVSVENVIEGLYLQGTDSYDFNEAQTSESKLASIVFKKYNNKTAIQSNEIRNNFVACYIDRPTEDQGGRIEAYENAELLSAYYQCRNMIEYTKISIFDYYENTGMEGFLEVRPDFYIAANVERSQVSNKYGFPGSLVNSGLIKFKDWLSDLTNIYNCPFPEMLERFAKFKRSKTYNCDITIAAMLCVISFEEYLMEMEVAEAEKPQTSKFRGYKKVNGILVPVYN